MPIATTPDTPRSPPAPRTCVHARDPMAIAAWSNPVRRRGARSLSSLPVEIYMMVLDEFRYEPEESSLAAFQSTLSSLTLVCRLFRSLVTPKLFRVLEMDGTQGGDRPDRIPCGKKEWITALQSKCAHASGTAALVQEITLVHWRDSTPYMRPVLSVMPRFRNVASVSLVNSPVTWSAFCAIASLPKLRALAIRDCDFERLDHNIALQLSVGRTAGLSHLEVRDGENLEEYIWALTTLAATARLRSLKTTRWELARAIMQSGVKLPLDELEVPLQHDDVDVLAGFLERSPTITHLSIVGTSANPAHARRAQRLALDTAALPLLQKLRCPAYLLPTLLDTRPVREVSLMEKDDFEIPCPRLESPDDIRSPLRGSALHSLEIPVSVYTSYRLARFVPKLDRLAICFPALSQTDMSLNLSSMCGRGHQSLRVRHLQLHFFTAYEAMFAFDLQLQHSLIMKYLAPEFPSAETISFVESLNWHWNARSSKWRPVFRAREYFRSLLMDSEPLQQYIAVRDFEGTLTGAFKDDGAATNVLKKLKGRRTLSPPLFLLSWP